MNNQIKIKLIESETIQDLIVKINKELKEQGVFASPITQDLIFPHFWYSLIYYRASDFSNQPVKVDTKPETIKPVQSSKTMPKQTKSFKTPFKPTTALLTRWKTQKPSQKTLNLLKSKYGYTDKELSEVKTQFDCYSIINSLKDTI